MDDQVPIDERTAQLAQGVEAVLDSLGGAVAKLEENISGLDAAADRREIWEVVYKDGAGRIAVWARTWDRDQVEKSWSRARKEGWPGAGVRMCVEWRTAWVDVPMEDSGDKP